MKQGKPFIDEVALKAVDSPFWKALNDILATYLSSAAKKRNVPAGREVRTAPEDYMILRYPNLGCVVKSSFDMYFHCRKIRSGSNGDGHWLRGLCAETEDDGECQKQVYS